MFIAETELDRFYLGRRTEDDERQISRWKGVAVSARLPKECSMNVP
jgi:hypothetical protein